MKTSNRRFVIDIMVVLFAICLLTHIDNNTIYIFVIKLCGLIYLFTRLLFSLSPKTSTILFMLFLLLTCCYESILGIMQLCGYKYSNYFLYACIGTFKISSFLGCYLSVCCGLFFAFCLKVRNKIIKSFFLIITGIALIVIPATLSRTAILSLSISVFVLLISNINTRIYIQRYGVIIALVFLIIAVAAYKMKKGSADGRMFMNRISLSIMKEKRLKGVGIGNYAGEYSECQASFFREKMQEGKDDLDWTTVNEHDRLTADCPDNAFNEYFQIGVEAGPIAMLLFVALILYAIIVSYKQGTIWCYGMIAFAVFAMFSYPLHIIRLQILFSILLAACASSGASSTLTGKFIMTALFIILSILLIFKIPEIKRYKQAESAWKKAERWHTMAYYEYVVEDCTPLLEDMKYDYRFLFAYGQSLNKTGKYEKSDSILMLGTKISSDPMFWNVMGNNSLALGNYREAEECYKHAFYMVPNRLYPLTLLAKLYHTEGDTIRFLYMAEKVETFIPKVESVNTEHLRSDIAEIKADY